MAEPIFHVPIVQQDLRQEETIVQIVDSLKFLQTCATCVFAKVDARLDESARKLHSVQARIAKCKQKVDKLASTKKAAKVLSTAKYPASEVYQPSMATFSTEDQITFIRSDYEVKSKIVVPYKNLQEKMQFFHVKNNNRMLRKNLDIASEEGLGKLPRNITSISSLLLFNTTENPYKTNLADRFGLHYRVKHAVAEPEESKPKQIVTPMKANNVEPDTKVGFYSPSMVQVPELDIPMDLPNLPGIADGLEFLMDFDTLSPAAPPPAPLPTAAPSTKILQAPVAPIAPPPLPQTFTPVAVAPPAPAPPVVVAPAAPSGAAPPPPPPPPPPQTVAPSFVEATSTSNTKAKPVPEGGSDMRASLMAAIRQAGGSNKLRSVSDKKMESKKKKQEEKEKVVSGDLMADLHAKLLLRRTGISGQNRPDGGGGIMEKISAMIPPPPVGGATPQHCDSEEGSDWEP